MALLINGTQGLVQVGPSSAPTTVGYVSEFSAECQTDLNERGPYIGDATIYRTRKAKTSSGSLSGDIPAGNDNGQKKLVDAHESGTNIRLVLRGGDTTNGFTYTAANAAISSVKFSGNPEDGYSFEFNWSDMDGYTLIPSS